MSKLLLTVDSFLKGFKPDPEVMIECILRNELPSYEKINAGEYYAEALKGEFGV